jgi:hypothetical protein
MSHQREPEEFELAAELMAIERQLAAIAPAALRIDRDQLMFAAGRAAERGQRGLAATQRVAGGGWFWPATAAMTTAASVVLAVMLWRQNEPIAVVQGAAKPQAADAAIANQDVAEQMPEVEGYPDWLHRANWAARPTQGYLEVRYIALTQGLGDLPADRSIGGESGDSHDKVPSKPATARGLLLELLPLSARHVDTRS